jgi:hypothetical protein
MDVVHFSVTAPASLTPGSSAVLDVWAHLEEQRREVIARAREALGGKAPRLKSKGGVLIARGTLLAVHLHLPDFTVEDPEDVLHWEGTIGNATFLVQVPPQLRPGSYPGTVHFHARGLRIARLHFTVEVGHQPALPDVLRGKEQRMHRAFASYASPDRAAVLGRVQGIQKALPNLDVFLDVASLRSGQQWEKRLWTEVTSRDIFYLFWSPHARQSQWVEWEWRTALEARGIDYIDPVPLTSPEEAPPPKELADHLHFNDWVLAYMRGRSEGGRIAGAEPRLLVLRGQKRPTEYPIYEGRNYLGRTGEQPVDIDLADQEPPDHACCSCPHACITFEDGRLFIEDLASLNGTFVNRVRIYPGQHQPLAVNDLIQIGAVLLKVTRQAERG